MYQRIQMKKAQYRVSAQTFWGNSLKSCWSWSNAKEMWTFNKQLSFPSQRSFLKDSQNNVLYEKQALLQGVQVRKKMVRWKPDEGQSQVTKHQRGSLWSSNDTKQHGRRHRKIG